MSLRHGAGCQADLAECDWPECYEPICARCFAGIIEEHPRFLATGNGAASGPYCSEKCANKDRVLGRAHPAVEQRCEFLESATRMSRWMRALTDGS